MSSSDVSTAFALTIAAGSATVLGGCVVFHKRLVHLANPLSLAIALSLSAGVMLFISLVEIYSEAVHLLHDGLRTSEMSEKTANGHAQLAATACFAGGIVLLYLVDAVVHHLAPHVHDATAEYDGLAQLRHSYERISQRQASRRALQAHGDEESGEYVGQQTPGTGETGEKEGVKDMDAQRRAELQRMSLLSAFALALHNFPEGIATFVAAKRDSNVGVSLAIGIGLHNIPEGIAVAAPIYFATGSRWRGLLWCAVSAAAEPLGGVLAWLVLGDGLNPVAEGVLFGLICGIMVGISIKELLPTAYRFAGEPQQHLVALGVFGGMFVMVTSLILFGYAGA
ncbi:hypothetical protein Poli38472_012521 [Pythium oligandrum]|uniref:Zinc transporter n=1 Tax=Pythium oligandrum TaxID=41045 RepID=A0A8K1CDT2_PYTOL|nr:hypothetical protein Poli38472_012521 [Pythium oligandrum]|eukprot:TMW61330.1 hypothetical protein Poli38472_012521 [Pythium oligandrum]